MWDGNNVVLAFNGQQQLTARYLNGPNTSAYDQYFTTLAEEDVASLTSAGTVTYDLLDNEGTVRDIVNASGQVVDHLNYDSFGKLVYESSPTVTHLDGYAGGLYDPSTGLVYFINRWYDPTATVWISADPMGFAAGDTNLTRYVGNDASNFIDPWGLYPDEVYVPPADLEGEAFNARLAAGNERNFVNWFDGAFEGMGEFASDAMACARQGFNEAIDHPIDTTGKVIAGGWNAVKGGFYAVTHSGKVLGGAIIDYHSSPTANSAGRKFGREAAKAGVSYGAGRLAGGVLGTCPVRIPPVSKRVATNTTRKTLKIYRKMSAAEAEQALSSQQLPPRVPGSNSNKYVSESLRKVQDFVNKGVPADTEEVIVEFEVDAAKYAKLRDASIPQEGSAGSGKIVFNTEGLEGTNMRNLGVPDSQLESFNEVVISVKKAP